MPRKTEKRRKSRKNRNQKNRTEKRKLRGGWKWPWQKDEPGEVKPVQNEGIKEEKEEIKKPEQVESSQPGEKKGWFDWLKPKPKEPLPPSPPATGGKRRRNHNKK